MKTEKKSSHKTAQRRRKYTAGIAAACGLVATGFVLQPVLGGFNVRHLAAPVNLLFGGAVVLSCGVAGWFSGSRFVKWFTGVPVSVCLLGAFCMLLLIMGLTPQGAVPAGGASRVFARLGFNSMTSSWPFVLVYTAILLSLGSLVARCLARFRLRDWGFYCNHLGLWLVLFAAGLGSADTERYLMRVYEGGELQRMAIDGGGVPCELPLAVRLDDFEMELYPPPHSEPKRFASRIEVFAPDGTGLKGTLEVNHPMRIGAWMLYQHGYDRKAGPASSYSTIELVRDPWLVPVYAGFVLIAVGAAGMIWNGARRKGGRNKSPAESGPLPPRRLRTCGTATKLIRTDQRETEDGLE